MFYHTMLAQILDLVPARLPSAAPALNLENEENEIPAESTPDEKWFERGECDTLPCVDLAAIRAERVIAEFGDILDDEPTAS